MTLADRITRRVRRLDPPVNAVHDGLNGRFSALWWPLAPPTTDRPLATPEHMLYAAHVGLALLAVAILPIPRRPVIGAIVIAGVGSWAVFTGAWDRRAAGYPSAAEASSARRAR